MRFTTKCPRCQALLETETAYVGAPRACKRCHATFILECPREVTAALEQARKPSPPASQAPPTELPELACAHCTSGFRRRTLVGAELVSCPYCGAEQPITAARRLVATLATAEADLWSRLLRGDTVSAAVRAIQAHGLSGEAAERLVRARVLLLPFVRAATQSESLEPGGRLRPPLHCECCRSALLGRWRLVHLHFATRRPSMTPVTLAPGAPALEAALQAGVDPTSGATRGAFYLCIGCAGSPRSAFERHPDARPQPDAPVGEARIVASRLQGQITWSGAPSPTQNPGAANEAAASQPP